MLSSVDNPISLQPVAAMPDETTRLSRRTVIGLLLILVLAAVMRFTNLSVAPVGGHGDVAWKGITALDWLDYGVWPYYVWELYAPEPVNVYLIGLGITLTGQVNYLAARLTSAIFGLGLVGCSFAATYWLLYPYSIKFRERAGLLAAAAAATSLHLMYISRLGMRAADFPTIVALLIWFTAWAWYRPTRFPWRWALAGLVVAFGQYLYIPARLFPFLLLLWMAHAWWNDPQRMRQQWRGWLTLFALAFLFSLPNILTFIRTPEAFTARADAGNATASTGGWIWQYDTSQYGGLVGLIVQKIGLALLSFGIGWDAPYTVLNQPMLTPLFFGGLIIAVYLLVRHPKQIAYFWPFATILVMLSTDLISGAILQLNSLRQSGVLGGVYIGAGIGLSAAWEWIKSRLSTVNANRLRLIAIIAAILPSLVGLYVYLGIAIPNQYHNPEAGVRTAQIDVDISNRINSQPAAAYIMPYTEYIRPPIAFLTADKFRHRRSAIGTNGMLDVPPLPDMLTVVMADDLTRIRLDGSTPPAMSDRWVLMVDGQTLLLPPLTPDQTNELQDQMNAVEPEVLIDASSTEIAKFYEIPTLHDLFEPRTVIDNPLDAEFNNDIRLLGYSLSNPDLTPGQETYVTFYWQPLQKRPADNYEVYVQIWDDQQNAVANWHGLPFSGVYTTPLWSPDEVIATHHWLKLPDTLPYGRYWLVTGFYRVLENTRLAAVGGSVNSLLNVAAVPDLRYAPPPPPETDAEPAETIVFGDMLQVIGLEGDALSGKAQPGQTLTLDITWEALQRPAADYNVFLHLGQDADAPPLAQTDILIGNQVLPTGVWRPGERRRDNLQLILPSDLPSGTYNLWMGVYDWNSGQRLSARMDDLQSSAQRILLTTIQIDTD